MTVTVQQRLTPISTLQRASILRLGGPPIGCESDGWMFGSLKLSRLSIPHKLRRLNSLVIYNLQCKIRLW